MNLWLPIITVIGLYNGTPVEYSYPLSSSLHYNEENCETAAIAEFNDFALAFVVTYVSDASKEELQGILNTIKFGDAAGDKPEPVKS